MGFNPLAISRGVLGLVLIRNVVVVLSGVSQAGRLNLQKHYHTSRCSGVSCLYSALASFAPADNLPFPEPCAALTFSATNTCHALETVGWGARSAITLSFFLVKAVFSASVRTFLGFLALGFGFGFALALFFFAGFGLALIRGFGFALDLVLDTAFDFVALRAALGAALGAALVLEVVVAFLAAVVVLPVWALGRDTAFCA